jgi:transcription elongation factor GreA
MGWLEEWDALIAAGNNAALEEFWLARLDHEVGSGEELVEALKRLRSGGKKTLAATLLELAAVEAEARQAWGAQKVVMREMSRLGVGDAEEVRRGMVEAVRRLWADRPSLETLLRHFDLEHARNAVAALDELELWLAHDVGEVFSMAGRGPGRVVEANPQLGVLRLDFERERGVPVPIHAAAKYLTPLPPGHFLRRRLEEPAAVRAEAEGDPSATLEAVLDSFAEPMGVSELRAALEGVVPAEKWNAWWARAKKHPRLLASGSGTRVRYRLAGGEAVEEEIRREFAEAKPAAKLDVARRHGSRSEALGVFFAGELTRMATAPRLDVGTAWEATNLAERLGAPPEEVEGAREGLLEGHGPLGVLRGLSDASSREGVLTFVREHSSEWPAVMTEWLADESHPRVLDTLAARLCEGGEEARLAAYVDQVLLAPQRAPAAMVWLCEAGPDGAVDRVLGARRGGPLLLRLVDLGERPEFAPYRTRLKEVLSPRGLAAEIVRSSLSAEQGRRLLQILERPGELGEERAWLRRAVLARFPELREAPTTEDVVPALPSTVRRLQRELRTLLEKDIPDTLKAIQAAREMGDLRENFEYHAARARQELLSARAAQLQADLTRVVVIEPEKVDVSVVRVGTRVELEGANDGGSRRLAILGPYEADVENGVLSHATEAVQGLLGREVGDEVEFDGRRWHVAGIEAVSDQSGQGNQS